MTRTNDEIYETERANNLQQQINDLIKMYHVKANKIVKAIIEDISDRQGLGNEWEACDIDIKKEIIEKWTEIITNILDLE